MARGGARPGSGRPKGSKEDHTKLAEEGRAYILARVAAELEPIMNKAIAQAKGGDVSTRKDLLDRAYGKPKETVEIQGVEFTFDDTKSPVGQLVGKVV